MKFSFLPKSYSSLMNKIEGSGKWIWEIRMRENSPVIIRTSQGDENLLDGASGLHVLTKREDIEFVLLAVSGQALYRISDALCSGVVYTEGGVRIGVCGRGVYSQGEIRSITDVSSLCIRFPYRITQNASRIFPYLQKEGELPLSTLVTSPPGGGKTTLLRDFANYFSNQQKNVVVIDERLELSCANLINADVIKEVPKDISILIALRTLNPDIIICDELFSESEVVAVRRAINGGISVLASLHANTVTQAHNAFLGLKNLFERYVCLERENSRTFSVYNQDFTLLTKGELC